MTLDLYWVTLIGLVSAGLIVGLLGEAGRRRSARERAEDEAARKAAE